jgi:hypothetical protein
MTGGTAAPRPSIGADRPRLVVVDELAVTSALDPYLSLQALATYSSSSVRWLRGRLVDPHRPLPCYRLPGGKILVRRSEFDAWIARHRQIGAPDVPRVVATVLGGARGDRRSPQDSMHSALRVAGI